MGTQEFWDDVNRHDWGQIYCSNYQQQFQIITVLNKYSKHLTATRRILNCTDRERWLRTAERAVLELVRAHVAVAWELKSFGMM
jgi:hypothetical protein